MRERKVIVGFETEDRRSRIQRRSPTVHSIDVYVVAPEGTPVGEITKVARLAVRRIPGLRYCGWD